MKERFQVSASFFKLQLRSNDALHEMLMKAELSVEGKKRRKKYVKLGDVVERAAKYDDTGNIQTSQEMVQLPILVGGRCE